MIQAPSGQNPPRQITIEKGGQQPQTVNGESKQGGRPFEAAFERFKLHEFHEQRSLNWRAANHQPEVMIA